MQKLILFPTGELSLKNEICDTAYGISISGKDGVGMGQHLFVVENCDDFNDGDWYYAKNGANVKIGVIDEDKRIPKTMELYKIIMSSNYCNGIPQIPMCLLQVYIKAFNNQLLTD